MDAQFQIKDLGYVYYFLGLEISSHPQGYIINQHKYLSDSLADFNCHYYSPISTLLDNSVKLTLHMGSPFADPSIYRRLIGKLNSFNIQPDIAFLI